jgi:hypothetical protein
MANLRRDCIHRHVFAAIVAATAVAAATACTSNQAAPLSPAVPAATVIPEASLKASTPTTQSPINDQRLASIASVTLVASAATGQYTAMAVQYRFQVYNDTNGLIADSGLVGAPTWTLNLTLTPLARYTWKVRAEYQGTAAGWSALASFTTPEQPSAYNKPIGNWQQCAGLKTGDLVVCVWDAVRPTDSVGDMEVTKRVAWLLRGDGAGLLIKESGENVVRWAGYSLSATRICYPDGHIYKLMNDAGPGGANSPGFGDNGFVDRSLYVPAIDPSRP